MLIRHFRKLGRKMVLGGGTLTGLLLGWTGTGPLAAQMPVPTGGQVAAPAAPSVPRNFLNKNVIKLPIKISEQSRSLISEIQLYVKETPTAAWTQRDKVGPDAEAFTFQVPRDGEYCFAMVTVDKQGRGFPSDLRNEPPGLIVVIDTTPPQIELINLGTSPEGQMIGFEARDPNLDSARTRFFYQGGDKVFRVLEPAAGRPGVYCVPSQAVFTGVVRATAEDLAGNQALRETQVSAMAELKAAPAELPKQKIEFEPVAKTPSPLPMNIQNAEPIVPRPVRPVQDPVPGATRPDWKDGPRTVEHVSELKPIVTPPPQPPLAPEQPVVTLPETLKRQFVNSTKVFLDYEIEKAGQSGVGKVEVWITRDRAKSWQRLSEDTQRNGKIEIQFPGEGIFGVTLLASNGQGVGAPAPSAGDTPDWWIDVDTTKPAAQFTKIHSTTEDGKAVVHIRWSAQDRNPGDAPVDLLYSKSQNGPWVAIAKGLKAEGQHRWVPPAELGLQTYLQLVARDSAGNMVSVNHPDAVLLDDPVRPRAVIRGITTGATTPTPAPMPTPEAPLAPLPLPSLPMPR